MIHERRDCSCVPDGLPALLQRFETTILGIWERIGRRPRDFLATLVGSSNRYLTCLLAWQSHEERDRYRNIFASDPEWRAASSAHQAEHRAVAASIVSNFLAPTAVSTLRQAAR
jgi:hypothetical protein